MNFLLSYSHSGSSWVRYIVEYVSKQPTVGFTSDPIGKVCQMGVDLSAEPILNQRSSILLKEINENNKLILLVRNYKHVYTRQVSATKYFFERYFEILKSYDDWTGPKLIIYYEDLLLNPSKYIPEILEFLDIENDRTFMGKYEKHFHCSLGIYRRFIKSDKHSTLVLSDSQVKTLDDALLYHNPILYGKYLIRYMYE